MTMLTVKYLVGHGSNITRHILSKYSIWDKDTKIISIDEDLYVDNVQMKPADTKYSGQVGMVSFSKAVPYKSGRCWSEQQWFAEKKFSYGITWMSGYEPIYIYIENPFIPFTMILGLSRWDLGRGLPLRVKNEEITYKEITYEGAHEPTR